MQPCKGQRYLGVRCGAPAPNAHGPSAGYCEQHAAQAIAMDTPVDIDDILDRFADQIVQRVADRLADRFDKIEDQIHELPSFENMNALATREDVQEATRELAGAAAELLQAERRRELNGWRDDLRSRRPA